MALKIDRSEVKWQELVFTGCIAAAGFVMVKWGGPDLAVLGATTVTTAITWLLGRMTTSKTEDK